MFNRKDEKMKKRVLILMLLMGSLYPGFTKAQEDTTVEKGAFICILGKDHKGNDEIIGLFKETQLPHFQDPRAPRFLLIDQKRKVALGIGGYVKMTVSSDFKGISDDLDFIPYDISVPNNHRDNGQYQMDVFTSRLFLKLVGNNHALGKYTAYLETDFRGPHHTLRLRQAYVSMKGFLLGMSWSTFSDLAALPPTIDFNGPNGNTDLRNVQLRYEFSMGKHWKAAVAAEAPDVTGTFSDETSQIHQRMPDIPMWIQFNWGKNSHIRASGLLRGLSYRNDLLEKNKMKMGWGVQLSGLAGLGPLTFFYQGTYGKGIAQYISDVSGNNLDLVPNTERPGQLQPMPVLGVVGGLQWTISPKFFVSANYSLAHAYYEKGFTVPDGYRQGQYICTNAFMNLTKECMLGVEYLHGIREDLNKEKGHANRIQAMIQYNF